MVDNYLKPVFVQTPRNDLTLVNKEFLFSGDCIVAKATSVKSSSDRKEASLELWAISFRYSTNTCRWPSFLAILSFILNAWMLSVFCISSKISYSCTVQGRGIPLHGLRLVSRQFILTHVVNFWPKYWFITWVNLSGEYSLLGSDSLFGSEQKY